MSVNKVILLGNLGADPELRYTPNQVAVCTLSIATNERRKGQDGQWTDQTEWHRVIVWQKQAENCAQYLSKGRQVYIEGKLQTRKWQDKSGNDRYTTEVIAQIVQFIGQKGEGGGASRGQASYGDSAGSGGGFPQVDQAANVSFEDDDIPF